MKLEPLYHNVLVDPMLEGDTTDGGLIIPAIATRKSPFQYGQVIATGAGRINGEGVIVPLMVKAGDVVMFARNAGNEVPIDIERGSKLMIMLEERYILGKVHGLAMQSRVLGIDGRLLAMEPQSRTNGATLQQGAAPDSVYKNQDELDRAERDQGIDTSDHVDEDEGTAA